MAQGGPFPSVRTPLFPSHSGRGITYLTLQFLGRRESVENTKGSFGKNWDRLVELKQKYDPTNLFRNTFWPLDEEGNVVQPSLREPEATFDHVPKFTSSDKQTNSAGTV